jgi:hypothetical protein
MRSLVACLVDVFKEMEGKVSTLISICKCWFEGSGEVE